jgi:hypothetical protein
VRERGKNRLESGCEAIVVLQVTIVLLELLKLSKLPWDRGGEEEEDSI